MAKQKIFIVEDEADIRELLEYGLEREGYDVEAASEGVSGLARIRRKVPDLILLDLMLPGIDGLEICRRLKQDEATRHIPIIMVTAKGEESDVVLGLGMGADDYIPKPFSPKEVVARVKAVMRRAALDPDTDERRIVQHGSVVVDPGRHRVTVNGDEIRLTATEFRILHFLAARPGRVFEREQILSFALGPNTVVTDRSVDVHVRAIRKKLGSNRDLIETVRGIGYRFAEAAT